ncbi:MAG: PspC domain-containing protein [Schleiferiaceae bacterium]|nr:PspC domain-containing protein [Schleiferiaceae bacterium]
MIEELRSTFEKNGFEVCSRLGERMGLKASRIRLFFIYASFMTLGSPLIIYFILAFVMHIKDYIHSRRTSVFDL